MSLLKADTERHSAQYKALGGGTHDNPFSILGIHRAGKRRLVRAFDPHARTLLLLSADDAPEQLGEPLTRTLKSTPSSMQASYRRPL